MIAGRGPSPSLVLRLVEALPDTSLTVALASGGRELYGWGQDRHIAVDTYDAINQNTRASGRWGGKKPPKIPAWPRPTSTTKSKKTKTVTVKDLFAQFSRR